MHIVHRGHDRRDCFRSDDDFVRYRSLMAEAAKRASCEVHAYVLMTNHVHLLVTPSNPRSAALMMHRIAGVYGHRFNTRYVRSGSVWEGRYWSCLIDSEHHMLACSRYLELNPVRAGMVAHPRDYPWSSYRGNAECAEDALLTAHLLYESLGGTRAERAASYAELFTAAIDWIPPNTIRRLPALHSPAV
jgi:putative transposase